MAPDDSETPGLEKVAIEVPVDWEVVYHRLFDVSPENAEKVEGSGNGVTIWDLCFLEDLLQIVHVGKRLLLDVGWYPHADPSGTYRLQVVATRGGDNAHWHNPMVDFKTRSLETLLAEIRKAVS